MADTIDITVPDLGDFDDVEVIEILVAAGDQVAEEDGLITLETDKASMDVPAPAALVKLLELTVAVGDKVSTGDKIGRFKRRRRHGQRRRVNLPKRPRRTRKRRMAHPLAVWKPRRRLASR